VRAIYELSDDNGRQYVKEVVPEDLTHGYA